MNEPIKKDINNNKNLNKISEIISDLDYFIFFGTLLGIIRDNNLISGDDDIDFLINEKDVSSLKKILHRNNFKITKETEDYVSFRNVDLFEEHTIDFYKFYIEGTYVYIPGSFYSNCKLNLKRHNLKIPQNIMFPSYKDELNLKIPKEPKKVLNYIYGKRWRESLKKNEEYFIYFKKNVPKIIYNTTLINILYLFRLLAEARYKAARRFFIKKTGLYKFINLFRQEYSGE